jgi:hypothetical protein
MDPQRMKEAYERLRYLEEHVAPRLRHHGSYALHRVGTEQLEDRLRQLTDYTLEISQVVRDLFEALANRPAPPRTGPEVV